jgi:hypothetical protein
MPKLLASFATKDGMPQVSSTLATTYQFMRPCRHFVFGDSIANRWHQHPEASCLSTKTRRSEPNFAAV